MADARLTAVHAADMVRHLALADTLEHPVAEP
jgi:hypothetical protein